MTQCKDCIHFSHHIDYEWIGHCALELPDWLLVKIDDTAKESRQVRADSGCDLGKS